jgi:hypothetical protein
MKLIVPILKDFTFSYKEKQLLVDDPKPQL